MKPLLRLGLFLVALAVVSPALAQRTPSGSPAPASQPPNRSHVLIEGGISPEVADSFLRDRLQEAETRAGIERLLNDLAQHPEEHGIESRQQRERLKDAVRNAGGQPEKLLDDPEVRKIIAQAANREQLKINDPEQQRRWEELARRYLPSEMDPLKPNSGQPFENPSDPHSPPREGPKPAAEGVPPTPAQPPALAPGASPPPPPAPAAEPAHSAIKDGLRDMAEKLADSRLAESPAFRRLVANIDRVKAPEADTAQWNARLERLESRFASVGGRLPKISWPRSDPGRRGRRRGISTPAGEPREAGENRQLLLVLLAAATTGLLAWLLFRRRGLLAWSRPSPGWRLGPWPIRPEAVATRAELVRAFEYLALLRLGLASRSKNHRAIADGLGAEDGLRRAAADRLADLYQQARYAPPDEALPDSDLAAARADLSFLAGVAAA